MCASQKLIEKFFIFCGFIKIMSVSTQYFLKMLFFQCAFVAGVKDVALKAAKRLWTHFVEANNNNSNNTGDGATAEYRSVGGNRGIEREEKERVFLPG